MLVGVYASGILEWLLRLLPLTLLSLLSMLLVWSQLPLTPPPLLPLLLLLYHSSSSWCGRNCHLHRCPLLPLLLLLYHSSSSCCGCDALTPLPLRPLLPLLLLYYHSSQVHYVVDKANWGGIFWKGSTGYITKDILAAHMPPPGPDNLVMVCGPPGMMAAVSGDKAPDKSQGPLSGLLKGMGYSEDMVYKF
jgi:hypothetical protein